MKTYNKIIFFTENQVASEILMSQLEDEEFYAFEIEENYLAGYIECENLNEKILQQILGDKIRYRIESIKEENWNAQWERSFEPVIIEDYVAVRAQFHQPVTGVKHEIVITPRMSFGTGHHATTLLMVREMKKMKFRGKRVIDFGTGTGLLAILAEISGAASILAIDNDHWSIENATDNITENNCSKITLIEAADLTNAPVSDIILANINKNILLKHAEMIAGHLAKSGDLLLSGIMTEDEQDLVVAFDIPGMKLISSNTEGEWIVLHLQKS